MTMNNLAGKTAIVTGASSGIGAKIAEKFAMEGANVILAARRKEKLTLVADAINAKGNGQAMAVVTDVSNRADVEDMVKQAKEAFGEVDIYVNNAGVMLESVVKEGNVEAWDNMIDVNIKGVLYGINAVLPNMIERETGHIVNISSVSGQEVTKASTVYSATKFAARALSMGLEKELARTGVRVTNVSPGMVDTDLTSRNQPKDRKPLNTADIANAIVYAVTQPDYVNINEVTVRPV